MKDLNMLRKQLIDYTKIIDKQHNKSEWRKLKSWKN